jgi:DNA-directed RNA polymerase subunit H (RpoH/RPB5)
MDANTNTVLRLFNSRRHLLTLLATQGYYVDNDVDFSIQDVSIMFNNNQLDMLLSNQSESSSKETSEAVASPKKVYVRYYTGKALRTNVLDEIIEQSFVDDADVLNKKTDTLIVVVDDEPNDSLRQRLTYLYDNQGIFVVVHNIKRLQYNLLKHVMVPEMTILSPEETQTLMEVRNIKDLSQLPEMSRFDPLALATCMRPQQVCRLRRISTSAYEYDYYRVCV